ncbi:unnamed protein product [Cylindrotheca closterium]|uniref:Uncharacterized protein n=1 Tax=Cylindrotheca closterium TaxID=2856 RepID=A0AAD2G7M3_9STRA|nr:unnamed protein product [Cylindrotheca closterium]
MTIGPISDQNNQTIAFLENEEFPEAIQSSSYALRYQRGLLLDEDTSANPNNSNTEPSSQRVDDCMVVCHELDGFGSNSAHSFIYRHGIPIPSTMNDHKIIAAILIFNTALAYHLSAISQRGTATAEKLLVNAKQLYELIIHCRQHISLDDNVMFQFAVINNIAVITRDQGNVAESNRQFDFLMALVNGLRIQNAA